MIQLKNIIKTYGEKDSITFALNDVSLDVAKGEFIAIMGTSGSGKSTLLNVLGLIDEPTQGEYFIDNSNTKELKNATKAKYRNQKLGFVMQDFALIPHYTVKQNILLPLQYVKMKRNEKEKKLNNLLEALSMANKKNAYPSQLSGGQKQRVAIARALVNDASILLCDEPTGALDSKTTHEIMGIFAQLNKDGKTVIIVTHDSIVASYCKRLIKIEDGKIVEDLKNNN